MTRKPYKGRDYGKVAPSSPSGYIYGVGSPGTSMYAANTSKGLSTSYGSAGATQAASASAAPYQRQANKYQSAYEAAYNALANREKFKYSQQDDPLYQQYADMYTKQAKLAMEDTVGQVSALTGGYGNSYAETAGQSMYMHTMDQLNERALDLYNAALNRYNMEGDQLAQQFNMAATMYGNEEDALRYAEQMAYQRERDAVADSRYAQEWQHQLDREGVEDTRWDKQWRYQQERDKVEDTRWDKQWDHQLDREDIEDKRYDANQKLAYYQAGYDPKTGGRSKTAQQEYDDAQRYQWASAGLDPKTGGRTVQSQLEWLASNGNTEGIKAYVNGLDISDAEKKALIAQYGSTGKTKDPTVTVNSHAGPPTSGAAKKFVNSLDSPQDWYASNDKNKTYTAYVESKIKEAFKKDEIDENDVNWLLEYYQIA